MILGIGNFTNIVDLSVLFHTHKDVTTYDLSTASEFRNADRALQVEDSPRMPGTCESPE
jgi:hypothetical protein